MLPLVIYIHDFRTSGVVRDSLKLAAHCSMHFPVTLVAGHQVGFLEGEARSGGYQVISLREAATGSSSRMLAAWQLRRWLRKHGPCALLSMGNMGHATPYMACRGLHHVQRVYRISNEIARNDGFRGAVRSRWIQLLIDDAERMPLVGGALAANPLFSGALRSGIAIEVNSGVDIAHARAMAAAPAPHHWLEEDIPVVLGIGRLRPQKNFGLLIDAMAMVRAKRQMRLAIIGGGGREERRALGERAARVGLGADFLLAGETHNVFSWLSRSRVFVLPSRWEGSSVALLEAMAVGVPVVASVLAGDASQVLDGGRWGRLFDGQSAEALAEAILLQASGLAVRSGDRVLAYSEPWSSYRALLEPLLRGA